MTNMRAPLKVTDFSHKPKQEGNDIGRPTVYIEVARGDTSMTVDSVVSQFRQYNWERKLNNGQSFLVIGGPSPLHPDNADALEHFLTVLNPMYTEVYTDGHREPSRGIKREADRFTVDIGGLDSKRPEAMEYFAEQSRQFDAVDFHVRHENFKKTTSEVPSFTREHKLYNHNIYLYSNDYESDYKEMKKAAIQYGWNVNPPSFDHFDDD